MEIINTEATLFCKSYANSLCKTWTGVSEELLKQPFLLYDTGKQWSKFCEDWSINNVTILSTDTRRTDGRLRDFIFCPTHMHCIGQTKITLLKSSP